MTERELLERLVERDPITSSSAAAVAGYDDECFWCEEFPCRQGLHEPWVVQHAPGCAWVDAMRFLGRDLRASDDGTLNVAD